MPSNMHYAHKCNKNTPAQGLDQFHNWCSSMSYGNQKLSETFDSVEAIATRVEAIAGRLEAIATGNMFYCHQVLRAHSPLTKFLLSVWVSSTLVAIPHPPSRALASRTPRGVFHPFISLTCETNNNKGRKNRFNGLKKD